MKTNLDVLWGLTTCVVLALALIGIPWAWTVEPSDATSPFGAFVLVIRGFSSVILLCLIVLALQWISNKKDVEQ